jgi:hypothetical protein
MGQLDMTLYTYVRYMEYTHAQLGTNGGQDVIN